MRKVHVIICEVQAAEHWDKGDRTCGLDGGKTTEVILRSPESILEEHMPKHKAQALIVAIADAGWSWTPT